MTDDYVPLSKLWHFHERRDGQVGFYSNGSYRAHVEDMDGDESRWSLSRVLPGHDPVVLVSGYSADFNSAVWDVEIQLVLRGLLHDPLRPERPGADPWARDPPEVSGRWVDPARVRGQGEQPW